MSKTSELIDDINRELKTIRHLSEELQERYRTIAAMLASAKTLVPDHKWDSWLHANCNMEPFSAQVIMEGEFMNNHTIPISIQDNPPALINHHTHSSQQDKTLSSKRGRKKKEKGK